MSRNAMVGICLALLLFTAGCNAPEREPSGEVTMDVGTIGSREVEGERIWDLELVVTSEVFKNVKGGRWSDMRVLVKAPDGTVLIHDTTPLAHPGSLPSEPTVLYMSRSSDPEFLHVNDTLILAGIDDAFNGAEVMVLWEDDTIFYHVLPERTIRAFSVIVQGCQVEHQGFPDLASWRTSFEVASVSPENAVIPWSGVSMALVGPGGETLMPATVPAENPGPDGHDDDSDGRVDLEAWFSKGSSASSTEQVMEVGDAVDLTGVGREHQGASIHLLLGGDLLGSSPQIPIFASVDVTVEFNPPSVRGVWKNETVYWEAELVVTGAKPINEPVNWSDVGVKVTSVESTVLLEAIDVAPDTGAYCASASAWFREPGVANGIIDRSDVLVLKGMDLGYRGSNVSLTGPDNLTAHQELPTYFPLDGFEVYLGSPEWCNRSVGQRLVWDVTYEVRGSEPLNIPLVWEDLQVRIEDGRGKILLELREMEEFAGDLPDTPSVFFCESVERDGRVDPSEGILVAGLNLSFENSTMEIWFGNEVVEEAKLPWTFDEAQQEDIAINLAAPMVSANLINGIYYHFVILNINKLTPMEAVMRWANLKMEVVATNGTVLVPTGSLYEDTGEYDEDDRDGIDIELWYIETTSGSDRVSAGDALMLTGLTLDFEGATIRLYHFGHLVGAIGLPTNFP